jgi:hypothetical protein
MRRALLWSIYSALLLVVTIAGAELLSSFFVPAWPARELRPVAPTEAGQPMNSWGVRDKELTIERPRGTFRAVFIGDSFLESLPGLTPVPRHVERRLAGRSPGRTFESINLGVAATNPRHYYYRLKHVALELQPNVVLLFFYSGNDFIYDTVGRAPPFIAEMPQPSILGAVAPRLTWLAVNRLRLSELMVRNKEIPGESGTLNGWLDLPRDQLIDRVVRHMKTHYYPAMEESVLREIYSRNNGSYWDAFAVRGRPESEVVF